MELRIKELQEKYWAGETSLAEEAELKDYFRRNPSLSTEGRYWDALRSSATEVSEKPFRHPGGSWKYSWSVAAAIVVGLATAVIVIEDAKSQREFVVEDPKEAYEITRKVLLMVSSGLNEGQVYTKEIDQINKAQEIISEEK